MPGLVKVCRHSRPALDRQPQSFTRAWLFVGTQSISQQPQKLRLVAIEAKVNQMRRYQWFAEIAACAQANADGALRSLLRVGAQLFIFWK